MATYRCPPGYIAAGLFLNRSQTSGFIRLESGIGAVSLDCRFIPHPLSWVGIVVPIMDPIGDGEIRLTVSPHLECHKTQRVPDTHDDANAKGVAEVAEIVLIKRLFAADLEHEYGEPTRHGGYTSIEELPWAEAICRDAYQATDSMIDGIGEIGFGSKGLLHTLLDLVRTKGIGTEAWERARTLLLIGSHCSALEVLSQSISDGNQDPALLERHQRLSSFLAACNESLK
jgi:hypothetical protein